MCLAIFFFTVLLWLIWKWSCKKVFNSSSSPPISPGKTILKYVDNWLDVNRSRENMAVKEGYGISWSPPPSGWVKLNIDGSWKPELGIISVGVVIRDDRK